VVAHALFEALLDNLLLGAVALLYFLLRPVHSSVHIGRGIGNVGPLHGAPDFGPELSVAYTEEDGEGTAYRRKNGKRSSQHLRLTR
jgi:hypothetical protein